MKTVKRNNKSWLSSDTLSFGDYHGSTVERANVEAIAEDIREEHGIIAVFETCHFAPGSDCYANDTDTPVPEEALAVIECGDYGHRRLWLLDTEEPTLGFDNPKETIRQLEESYPCYDDEAVTVLENELEEEAWSDWIRSDLNKSDTYATEKEQITAYHAAKEEASEYGECETAFTFFIDVEKLAPYYRRALARILWASRKA